MTWLHSPATEPRGALTMRIDRVPSAPLEAREVLDTRLEAHVDPDRLYELKLVVTELVSNAVRHGAGEAVDVEVEVSGGSVRGAVTDAGDWTHAPAPREEPSGWGLGIVGMLADRWGVERGSTRVWFEISVDGDGRGTDAGPGG